MTDVYDTPTAQDIPVPVAGPMADAVRKRIAGRLFGGERAPTRIGRFEVKDVLGVGGMGVVYSAEDPQLDRLVALKLLSAERITDDRERGRLVREARALAKLNHPNVVAVHEVGEHDGSVFIVMEHVEGAALHHWQREKSRRRAEVVDVYMQAADGLLAAHEAGVVHRDFKPSNVLVGSDGRVRVADFGLARVVRASSQPSSVDTSSGSPGERTRSTMLGTPAYMAPEQSVGENVDERSDQFSFCVALWEAVFGVRPWEPAQVRAMAFDASERLPPAAAKDGPRWLRRTLLRGLKCDPGERWPSMQALSDAIRRGAARPRRLMAGVGFAAVAAAITTAYAAAGSPCDDDAAAGLDGAWSEATASALRERVSAAPAKFATDALPSIVDRLDAYASRWVSVRRATCEATFVRREQSEEQFDRSIACLTRARGVFVAAVHTLGVADPEVVARADRVLDQLPRPELCLDTRSLRGGPPPPGPEFAGDVAETENAIDRTLVLAASGRVDEALALGGSALERARQIGHAPTLAEAAYAHGTALASKGDVKEARAVLFEAATAAIGTRHHGVAVRAWHRLVHIAAVDLEDTERASEWHALAGASLELDGAPPILAAAHRDQAGLVASAQRDYESAAELHRAGAQTLRTVLPADDLRVIRIELHRGNAMLMSGETEEAESLYLELEERVADRLGTRHPEYAKLSHNLGLAAQRRGDYEQAARRFSVAIEIESEAFGAASLRIAPPLTAGAEVALLAGDLDRAQMLAERAWRIQRKLLPIGHSERASGLALLAAISLRRSAFEDALSQYRDLATEFAEGMQTEQLPLVYQNISWLLCELGRCKEARPMNERARELAPPDQPVAIYAEVVSARIELAEGRAEDAIERLEHLMPRAEASSVADHPELLPELRLALAKALLARARATDRPRAIDLLGQAEAGYKSAGTRPDLVAAFPDMRRALLDGPRP